jgi:hypothetical protein
VSSAVLLDRWMTVPCVLRKRTEGPPDADGVPTLTETTLATSCYVEQVAASEPAAAPAWTRQEFRVVLRAADLAGFDGADALDAGAWGSLEVTGGPWPVIDPHNARVHHVEFRARQAEPIPAATTSSLPQVDELDVLS